MTDLHICPDCGGILEPLSPAWTGVLDESDAAASSTPSEWRCLLCGYSEEPQSAAAAHQKAQTA